MSCQRQAPRRAARRRLRTWLGGLCPAALCSAALWLSACGPGVAAPPPKIQEETPRDEILRVGSVWQATQQKKGLESEPSPISVFTQRIESTLDLASDASGEQLDVSESFELRAGTRYQCRSQGRARVTLHFGRRAGEAALEVNRAPIALRRECQPPDFPEQYLELPAGPARFVLRSDQLVGVEPPLEKRVYLPAR